MIKNCVEEAQEFLDEVALLSSAVGNRAFIIIEKLLFKINELEQENDDLWNRRF